MITTTPEQNRELIATYPFLLPRNVFTDEIDDDYDYSYTWADDVPDGWRALFLQCCEDLKTQLIADNQLQTFRFCQIKEKYGTLRMYNYGCSSAAQSILDKYEWLSQFVCISCGKPATVETRGWISPFCDECAAKYKNTCPIERVTHYTRISYVDGIQTQEVVDCATEWERYLVNCAKS